MRNQEQIQTYGLMPDSCRRSNEKIKRPLRCALSGKMATWLRLRRSLSKSATQRNSNHISELLSEIVAMKYFGLFLALSQAAAHVRKSLVDKVGCMALRLRIRCLFAVGYSESLRWIIPRQPLFYRMPLFPCLI